MQDIGMISSSLSVQAFLWSTYASYWSDRCSQLKSQCYIGHGKSERGSRERQMRDREKQEREKEELP